MQSEILHSDQLNSNVYVHVYIHVVEIKIYTALPEVANSYTRPLFKSRDWFNYCQASVFATKTKPVCYYMLYASNFPNKLVT